MNELMSLQLPIMVAFQKIGSPFLDFLGKVITLFGEPYIAIPVLVFLYWCLDKRKGLLLTAVVLSANYFMNVAKLIIKAPRPFHFAPEKIANKRASTATGYAFPSGHTTGAASLFGTLSRLMEKRWAKVVLLLIPVLVGFSRLYLGAHWPLDVIFGLALGLCFAFFGYDCFAKLYDDEEKFIRIMHVASVVMAVSGVFSVILLQFLDGDAYAWKDFMEGAAMALGITLSLPLERKYVRFAPPKTKKAKILVFLVGLVLGLVVWFGLRSIPVLKYLFKFLAYGFLTFWVGFLFPFIGVKMGFFDREA